MINSNIFFSMVAIASSMLGGLIAPATCQDTNLIDNICVTCAYGGPWEDVFGLYRFTWAYRPHSLSANIDRVSPASPTAFDDCGFSSCANQIVQHFLQKMKQNCNGYTMQCYDYATFRSFGGSNCPINSRQLSKCLVPYKPKAKYYLYRESSEEPITEAKSSELKPARIPSEELLQTFTVKLQENVTKIKHITQNDNSTQNNVVEVQPLSISDFVPTKENPITTASPLKSAELPQLPPPDDSIQNFDYSVIIPQLSVFELLRAKENTTTAAPRNSGELPQLPPPDDSVQNFDYSVTIPPLSVFELVQAKESTTTAAARKSAELPQLPPPDDSVQNFDYSVTIPPLSVFELVQAKESTSTAAARKSTQRPQLPPPAVQNIGYSVNVPPPPLVRSKGSTTTAPLKSAELPQLPPPDNSVQNFDYSVTIPPLSVFELVQAKESTSTAAARKSTQRPQLPPPVQNIGYSVNVPPPPLVRSKGSATTATPLKRNELPQLAPPDDSVQNFDYSVTIPPLSVFELIQTKENTTTEANIFLRNEKRFHPDVKLDGQNSTSGTDGSQLKSRTLQSSQNIIPNKVDGMVKSNNEDNDESLRFQKINLELFLNSTRIDEEEYESLKEIAQNIKQFGISDGAVDDIQLKIRTLESKQDRYLKILQGLEKVQNDHNEKYLNFRQKFLDADLKQNRIEEERNKILREIAKNIKKPGADRIVGAHFLNRQ